MSAPTYHGRENFHVVDQYEPAVALREICWLIYAFLVAFSFCHSPTFYV
jgi:hypothetical protein